MWVFLLVLTIAVIGTALMFWAVRAVSKDRQPWREEYPELSDSEDPDQISGDPDHRV